MKQRSLNINKTMITVIILNSVQALVLVAMIIFAFLGKYNFRRIIADNINLVLLFLLAMTLLDIFLGLRDRMLVSRIDSQFEMLKESLSQVETLNKSLRMQRHDFMNHLQVIYSLMEMEEAKEAQNYLERVYSDIQKISRILKTANPAVNALLQAKLGDCEERGITTRIEIRTRLQNLPIADWEFCRVLGNLIDNAMDALAEKPDERKLEIELYEDLKSYGFKVSNNGPPIPEELFERIFEAGFTTKGAGDDGMGLAIVKEILGIYQGEILVQSNSETTFFAGWIPKDKTAVAANG